MKIASKISIENGIRHQHFDDPLPSKEELIALIEEYAAINLLVEPVSSALRLRYYQRLFEQGNLIIDGGFGEIARRQYLNKIITFGRNALYEKNSQKSYEFFCVNRGDIFQTEISQMLKQLAVQSLENKFSTMPDTEDIGIENFVDMLTVRSRFPNFGEVEQSRSDAFIVNFMPMAQPSFLKSVFSTAIKERKNGRYFRNIIKKNLPILTKYELVKGGNTYPFFMSTKHAYVFVKIKNWVSHPFKSTISDKYLNAVKDFVLDLVVESKSSQFYAHKKFDFAVNSYYKGDKRYQKTVEWWLTFELWRRSLQSKK